MPILWVLIWMWAVIVHSIWLGDFQWGGGELGRVGGCSLPGWDPCATLTCGSRELVPGGCGRESVERHSRKAGGPHFQFQSSSPSLLFSNSLSTSLCLRPLARIGGVLPFTSASEMSPPCAHSTHHMTHETQLSHDRHMTMPHDAHVTSHMTMSHDTHMIKQHLHALDVPVDAAGVDRCLLVGVLLLRVQPPAQEDEDCLGMT